MAEGRWLPWKEQKMDIRPFPDYKELVKPLKPPPHGLEWRRLKDGSWELRKIVKHGSFIEENENAAGDASNAQGEAEKEKIHVPEFLEHVVMAEDTLTGICMRYKVKDRELRRLNGFIGNHFRMCDTLVVPNNFKAGEEPKQGAMLEQPQTRPELLQRFRNVSYLGDEEAKYYLESNGWDLGRAVAEWRSEKIWESQSQAVEAPRSPAPQQQHKRVRQRKGFDLRRRESFKAAIFPVVSGMSVNRNRYRNSNSNSKYTVADDGTIEMTSESHVPLLSA